MVSNTIPACDTHTDKRTHDDGYYPRITGTNAKALEESVQLALFESYSLPR